MSVEVLVIYLLILLCIFYQERQRKQASKHIWEAGTSEVFVIFAQKCIQIIKIVAIYLSANPLISYPINHLSFVTLTFSGNVAEIWENVSNQKSRKLLVTILY